MKSRKVLPFLLIVCLGLNYVSAVSLRNEKLKFKEDHTYTILQLTDLHYGEDDEQKTYETQYNLIKMSNPDLVVVTGDSVSGYVWDGRTQGFFENIWRNKFSKVFDELKVNYLYILGNHDDQGDLDREAIMKLDMTHNYSRTNSSAEVNWTSTYNTPIYSAFNDSILAVI